MTRSITLLAVVWVVWVGCTRDDSSAGGDGSTSPPPQPASQATLAERIHDLCSKCHLYPEPTLLPKWTWPKEVARMYELAGLDSDIDLGALPSQQETLEYFVARAPDTERTPQSFAHVGPGSLDSLKPIGLRPTDAPPTPAVSFVKFVRLYDPRHLDLIFCDMRHGSIMAQRLYRPDRQLTVIGRVPHPAHLEVADLDADGRLDLLVADLGSFEPSDHDRGRVIWLRGVPGGRFEPMTLLENVGRVADVQAADIDRDGDLDLAVAIFGWRTTGKVVWLENRGSPDASGRPQFREHVLDERSGAINVPIVDIDGDGRLDVVTVLAQQFETVVAYLNRGDGGFEPQTIFQAPHPDWGSSGIEIADIDGDGDLDVAQVNGDALDNSVLKTFHGITFLENRGAFPFHAHALFQLAGAHKVRAVDLDDDGDLDMLAASFLPQFPMERARKPLNLESIIWLEQISKGKFERHSIEALLCDHPSLDAADFDADGDIDFAVGNYALDPSNPQLFSIEHWLTVYENGAK